MYSFSIGISCVLKILGAPPCMSLLLDHMAELVVHLTISENLGHRVWKL
jgi:hypothetical protein